MKSGSRPVLRPLVPVAISAALTFGVLGAGAYEVDTHRNITESAVKSPYSVLSPGQHGLLGFLGFQSGLDTQIDGHSALDWMLLGAEEEDTATFTRPARHFLNPLTNYGYSDAANQTQLFPSAVDWAWNGGYEGGNEWDWRHARGYERDWLTASLPEEREAAAAKLFRSLGHVSHLLQDMAQPQHTRNDAHAYLWLGGTGAPYEQYCSANFGYFDIDWMVKETPPYQMDGNWSLGSNVDTTMTPVDPRFRSFWDTDQYTGQDPSTLNIASLGLAEYSNAFFVTNRTMFTGDQTALMRNPVTGKVFNLRFLDNDPDDFHFKYPRIGNTELAYALSGPTKVNVVRGGDTPFYDPTAVSVNRTKPFMADLFSFRPASGPFQAELILTDKNYDAHARALLPKAVSYTTGLLNYFFRGSILTRRDIVGGGPYPLYVQFTVTNTSKDSFEDGEWNLMKEVNGMRTPVPLLDGSKPYRGILAAGDSCTFLIPYDQSNGRLWMVFQGTIGTEKDIAIAAEDTNWMRGN